MMEALNSTAAAPFHSEPANYDEASMQQSLLFSDSLKDLKNLRKQLYTAAEYFELSYTNDDQKQIMVNTLKDYAVKALVNTVDHLGSVTYKVNDLLDEKVGEVTGTELRVSCIEKRLRTCQEYIDSEGHLQQSLNIETPKYHKRYILPVGETMYKANGAKANNLHNKLNAVDDWRQFKNAVKATIKGTPPASTVGKLRSPSPMPEPTQQQRSKFRLSATMPKNNLEKRTVSPHRFPLLRSGSFSSKPTTPKTSRSTTPNQSRPTLRNSSFGRHQPQKSASMRFPDRENLKDVDQIPSKSKRLLKALLSRRKSKNDDTLYTYLDEYT
ncbi:scaffold/adaptor protein [Lithospermum erythrorhizon]|uniref:Scaffold/adaptor protein n=1 Tax=Lithospermum erythrorhizon TaxID=34254 RepID=A0AAV3P0F6_LITER